ncbi:hypothetical protein A7A08_01058 [Methyloligella halotolerans]|uniref:2TM domain-containing protein n=1 Tax=Methyloligella halotolerans TaxID=1177755 RepID=A0A1E2S094_9HYPH|nr:2TM domain-containing protein [Methyloligella halotolerans]ODA67891.1 hypothetical protein A7A08_01058 [Methyloligella halotolerans]
MPENPRLRGFFIHLGVFLVVVTGLAVLNLVRNPDHLWFPWVIAGWGVGVIAHGIVAYRRAREDESAGKKTAKKPARKS